MSLLRLDRVQVHVANAAGSGSTAAPDGTHVWLDVPGGRFEFNHYVVQGGHLVPQGAAGAAGRLDTRWAYWSVYADTDLGLGTLSSYGTVTGFGYPLPARIRRSRLILPATRTVTVHYHNLTSDPADSQGTIASAHRSAAAFYQDLHIALDFQPLPRPASVTEPLYLTHYGVSPKFHLSVADPLGGYRHVDPDLGSAPWLPPGPRTHALIELWVQDFHDMGPAEGNAWPYLHVNRAEVSLDEAFRRPPSTAFFCMRFTRPGARSMNRVAHEIAHCLLHDPGLGRQALTGAGWDRSVKAFLGRLQIEGPFAPGEPASRPGERLWAELFDGLHGGPSGNLMGRSGGTGLLPWQVAVMRAAAQVGDGP